MHTDGIKFLNFMFRPGENVCVSPSKYGYHSIPLENVFAEQVALAPPKAMEGRSYEDSIEYCPSDRLTLVALNPIQGFRKDSNCYRFRNFLIELDHGSLAEQMQYVKQIKMPYSGIVFSGNKSLHFLISLDIDLPNEKAYRTISEWMLNIVTLADKNCKNPSRSIRIPGALREEGKLQRLVELKESVKFSELLSWLNQYPHLKPKEREKKVPTGEKDFSRLSKWVQNALIDGIDFSKGRNRAWFALAVDFSLASYSLDATIEILSDYFEEDRDFKEKEWLITLESAFKYVSDRK